MTLHEHDGSYAIRVDGRELMATRQHASEEELSVLACKHISEPGSRVLIGGLGFGFSLGAALSVLPKHTKIVVVELVQAVIDWNRRPELGLAGKSLADRRVQIVCADVVQTLRTDPDRFDAIILDVDNGPSPITVRSNRSLYNDRGLALLHGALRPGGCIGIWSAEKDDFFATRMKRSGFEVEVVPSRAHQDSGRKHTLFFGRVGSKPQ